MADTGKFMMVVSTLATLATLITAIASLWLVIPQKTINSEFQKVVVKNKAEANNVKALQKKIDQLNQKLASFLEEAEEAEIRVKVKELEVKIAEAKHKKEKAEVEVKQKEKELEAVKKRDITTSIQTMSSYLNKYNKYIMILMYALGGISIWLLTKGVRKGVKKRIKDFSKLLLKHITNVSKKQTPLMKAALANDAAHLQVLLNKDADVNAKDKDGNTALSLAVSVSEGLSDTVEALLAQSADVEAKDNEGCTALMDAASKGKLNIVSFLLAQGADMNIRDIKGRTALLLAVENGHKGVVEKLLVQGANVNTTNSKGETAFIVASRVNDCSFFHSDYSHSADNILFQLLNKDTDVNAKDSKGETALMKAASLGYNEKLLFLLFHGANVNAIDNDGLTALMKARAHGRVKAVEILKFPEGALRRNGDSRYGVRFSKRLSESVVVAK